MHLLEVCIISYLSISYYIILYLYHMIFRIRCCCIQNFPPIPTPLQTTPWNCETARPSWTPWTVPIASKSRPAGDTSYSEDVLVTLSHFIETLEPLLSPLIPHVETKLIQEFLMTDFRFYFITNQGMRQKWLNIKSLRISSLVSLSVQNKFHIFDEQVKHILYNRLSVNIARVVHWLIEQMVIYTVRPCLPNINGTHTSHRMAFVMQLLWM